MGSLESGREVGDKGQVAIYGYENFLAEGRIRSVLQLFLQLFRQFHDYSF